MNVTLLPTSITRPVTVNRSPFAGERGLTDRFQTRFGNAEAFAGEGPVAIPVEEVGSRWGKIITGVGMLGKNIWRFAWKDADYKTGGKRILQSLYSIGQNVAFFTVLIAASFLPIPAFRRYIERQYLYSPIKYSIRQDLKSEALKNKDIMKDEDFRSIGDNTRLHGWYIPAEKGKPTAVYAHGRDHNIGDLESVLEGFRKKGWGVFAFDYRGFGDSAGKPTEEGLYEDFESACHHLQKKYDIPFSEQVAVGHSMGTAVVTEVAANRIPNFKSVVLVSPFTSMQDALVQQKKRFPFVNWLFNHQFVQAQMNSIEKIGRIQSPILSICGGKDTVTPPDMSQSLLKAASCGKKQFVSLPDADHHTGTLFSADNANTVLEQMDAFVAPAECLDNPKAA